MKVLPLFIALATVAAGSSSGPAVLWYNQPAAAWHEALPVGNGRLGAMAFGGTARERIALNEATIWSGKPGSYDRVGAHRHLPEIRRLLFEGKHAEAEALTAREMLGERPTSAANSIWTTPLYGPATESAP
jgi:alpha-L-fucosidase 2